MAISLRLRARPWRPVLTVRDVGAPSSSTSRCAMPSMPPVPGPRMPVATRPLAQRVAMRTSQASPYIVGQFRVPMVQTRFSWCASVRMAPI